MDNPRFNVTGDSIEELGWILTLVFQMEFPKWPEPHRLKDYGCFTGYRLDPHLGLVLYQYPLEDDKETRRFPFGEGNDPLKLAQYVWSYLKSDLAKVEDPPLKGRNGLLYFKHMQHDFEWDRAIDHDGDNGRAFRVFIGDWGHIPGHDRHASFAIRPITAWYGK